MIRFACPSCDAVLEAPESKGGGIMCCPECEQKMQVPEPDASSARKGSRDDDEDDDVVDADAEVVEADAEVIDDEDEEEGITATPRRGGGARARRDDDDDDDDDDEEDRPRKRKKSADKGGNSTLMVLVLVLVVVALAGGAFAVYMIVSNKEEKVTSTSSKSSVQPSPGSSSGFSSPPDSSSSLPTSSSGGSDPVSSSSKSDASDDPLNPKNFSGDRGPMITKRLLKSTAIIFVWTQAGGTSPMYTGSGYLIDRKNRLVLTNNHVAEQATKLVVLFPEYEKGVLIPTREYYERKAVGTPPPPEATVLAKDPKRDLALLKLSPEQSIDGLLALRPAEKEPPQTASVFSLGNPGASGGAFSSTTGNVKQVFKFKWTAGTPPNTSDHEALIVETQNPTNPGDSGGPLVNEDAEFVGITQGGNAEANLLSIFIAVSEIKSFLNENLPKQTPPITWEIEKEGSLEPAGGGGFTAGSLVGLRRVLKEKDPHRRAEAARAISTITPIADARPAIPDLLTAIKDEDDVVSSRARDSLEKIGAANKFDLDRIISKYLTDSNPVVKHHAIMAISLMGPDGAPACDKLIELCNDTDAKVRGDAIMALGKVGAGERQKVFTFLFGQLKDARDARVRATYSTALEGLGAPTPAEINALKDNLAHSSSEMRVYCARALGKLGPSAKDAVSALASSLKHEDLVTAVAAAEALGKIGTDAKDAKSALFDALQSNQSSLSKAAADALVLIKDVGKADLPILKTALTTGPTHVKASALSVIASMGQDGKDAVSEIGNALKDSDKSVRVQAMKALENFGASSPGVLTKIIDAVKDPDAEIRTSAIRSLGKVGSPAGKEAVKVLDDILAKDAMSKDKNLDINVVKEAVIAVGLIHLESKTVPDLKYNAQVACHVVELLSAEEDRYASLAEVIGTTLGKMGNPALTGLSWVSPPKKAAVVRLLESNVAERRYYATVAIKEMLPELKKQPEKERTALATQLNDYVNKELQFPQSDPRTKQTLEDIIQKLKSDI